MRLKQRSQRPSRATIVAVIMLALSLVSIIQAESPSVNFAEAIEDIETVPPSNVTISSFWNIFAKFETGTEAYDDEELQASDFILDCGLPEQCASNNSTENSDLVRTGADGKSQVVDFSSNPYSCHCETDDCLDYGDCCRTALTGQTLKRDLKPWRCNKFHEKDKYALMISECGPEAPAALAARCSAKPETSRTKNYTYLMDIPVYSTVTHLLYRNIYCARCHQENNSGLVQWKTRLYCNVSMTFEDQQEFIQTATYLPGERILEGNNSLCAIFIANLVNNDSVPLSTVIPNIRYCSPNQVETCPTTALTHVMTEEDKKNRALCYMYSQHMKVLKDPRIFKNPHCALCNGAQLESWDKNKNVTKKLISCFKGGLVSILRTPIPSGPMGIHLLFDFSLDGHENIVGYDTICKDDEIWDYLHKRCQMAICRRGYYLVGDTCQPSTNPGLSLGPDDDASSRGDEDELNKDSNNNSSSSSNGGSPFHGKDGGINSTCMRILLFEGEYSFLSKNNSSIMINSTARGQEEPVIFHEHEYEYWNDTTLAVCAKDLHEGFLSRFSVVLNYISTISMAISVIFSFLHILLYILLPKLRNLPGKNLFCLTLSLFISQLIFLTLINHSRWQGLCVSAAIAVHYFYLAAFCWMNVMSFDMWRTFSGATLLTRNQSVERKQITFLKYSAFSWITPFIIVSLAVLVEFLPASLTLEVEEDGGGGALLKFFENIRPSYGQNGSCWIGQRLSLFVFFAAPVALVILSNLILFSLTAQSILRQNREAEKVLKNRDSVKAVKRKESHGSSQNDVVKAKLYAKLALIMGLTWTLGFFSNFARWDWLWFVFVLFNGLQGTFIFFAFDCKRKILGMVRERGAKNSRILQVMKFCKCTGEPTEESKSTSATLSHSQSSNNYIANNFGVSSSISTGLPRKQNRSISFCGTTSTHLSSDLN